MSLTIRSVAASCLTCLATAALAADNAPQKSAPSRYQQAPGSSLTFTFTQLGAATEGGFGQFATELRYDEQNLGVSSLRVTVQIGSIDTQDDERDSALVAPELLDAQKHPVATFVANSLARSNSGVVAPGRLTIRGVTREMRLPLAIRPTATGLELSGATSFRRLDFGIGQGDWQSTESVGDEVKVQYKVLLTRKP